MAKKKMSKQDKKRAEAEQAEALRIEMEKQRQKQLDIERERMILELKEAKERQKREKQENKLRRIQLSESDKYFDGIRDEINKIDTEMRQLNEWKRYMRCNGLPNAYDSGDLRQYIHMWCLENEKYNRNEQNWLLHTNERTILTQNRLIENRTRINLQRQQINAGDLYARRAKEVLGILEEIDEAIADPYTLKKSIIRDLHQLKIEFREKMADMMDEFSFKILSNIERDMVLDGLFIATHLYECDEFKTHLWTKLDIPQPQLNEREREKEAKRYISIDFKTIRLNLCLPPSVKCKNGALRAMWLNYDHFSDCCPTFEPPIKPKSSLNLNISIAARKEWKKRKEILKTSNVHEQQPLLLEDNVGAVPFDNFETICTTAIVDVDKLYTDYMNELTAERRMLQGPESLCLNEFEINLRKYRIIGGIYCVEYFEQPQQDTKHSSNSYLRTITGANTLKRRNFFQYYRAPPPLPAGVRRLPEEAEAEMKAIESGLSKLAYITITLPDDVLWFEPPTVCRWETIEETKSSLKLESKQFEGAPVPKTTAVPMPSVERKRPQPTKVVEDFNILNIPSYIDLSGLMRDFFMPNMPDGYTINIQNTAAGDAPAVVQCINDFLCETNSPRWLFPKRVQTRPLHIVEKSSTDDEPLGQSTYMFSQLLNDLNELWEQQEPFFERQNDENLEMLSMSVTDGHETVDAESEPNFKDMPLIRAAADYPFSFLPVAKKEETIDEGKKSEDEDSEEDSIDIDDDVGNANLESELEDIHPSIGRWSVRDVHDPKFNEEKLAIQFRSGRLGHFGLAVNWYCNLPYQTWELRPNTKITGQVTFSLTAAIVSIDLTATADGVTLNSFQGGVSSIVQKCVGTPMAFGELSRILKRAGINLFPEHDAFCYCETACEKNIVMESHLYTCMACLALTHNFMWSRWNSQVNSSSAVLLMREIIDQRKPAPFSTLFVSTLKAYFLDCSEVSTSFNATPLTDTKFYADLYQLTNDHSQPKSKEKQHTMDAVLRDNIVQILKAIRPLSFC